MMGLGDELGPITIHKDWQALWAPTLQDNTLREGILTSEEFSQRIGDQLIGTPTFFLTEALPDQDKLLRQIDVHSTSESMHYTGLMWLAPRLVLCLAAKDTRRVCGDLSLAEVRDIAHFRGHVPFDLIEQLPESEEVAREGWKCLAAWTAGLGGSIAGRLRLQLPPGALDMIDHFHARASLMTKVIRYRAEAYGEG